MKSLASILQDAVPSVGVQLRKTAYGERSVREFLRDVIAIANASVEGPRYIVVGVATDKRGRRQIAGIDRTDFAGKPAYPDLAGEYIEPQVRIQYEPVDVDGKLIGVYTIGDCHDRPYMMRADHSETLRRGDAYMRVNDAAIKMGRRQLQALFERKFQESVSAANVEIGFPGEIIHKDRSVPTCDLSQLPSSIAASKLRQMIEIKSGLKFPGSTTMVARLAHARLFGPDAPYEERSTDELAAEMQEIEHEYRDQDDRFLFEEQATSLQLVVYNQGDEPVRDASLALLMPNPSELHVAIRLPKAANGDRFAQRAASDRSGYPTVELGDGAVRVSGRVGDIPAGELVEAFRLPLRICAGNTLKGRKLGLQYSLFAENLRTPARGRLRLLL